MDPRTNPYAPGAGAPPPELAGRDHLIEQTSISLDRLRNGLSARGQIFYGLRGVGKTVLLNLIRNEAEATGFVAVFIEAPENRSLPSLLAPALRAALLKLDWGEAAKTGVQKALRALSGFTKALKVKYHDIELAVDLEPEKGLADSGDLDADLSDLLTTLGAAANDKRTAVVFFIDELQYVKQDEFASLISALHAANQRQLPITMIAAGLPQVLAQAGKAKSYVERLFEFTPLERLDRDAATLAVLLPAQRQHVDFEAPALEHIYQQTAGYPYFLQEWGKHSWNVATASPITASDALRASRAALAELDTSFFRVRFNRLTPSEKRYMRAMSELGSGPHRSGDIAAILGRKVESLAPVRSKLIAKGMLYSPNHGDTAFTVPLFDDFMRRIMPGAISDW